MSGELALLLVGVFGLLGMVMFHDPSGGNHFEPSNQEEVVRDD